LNHFIKFNSKISIQKEKILTTDLTDSTDFR
jgi:hypothetical protein